MRNWLCWLRMVDGGYFVWRGLSKWVTPPGVWLVPRVTAALPTTPLAPWIRAWVFPHAVTFGWVLGGIEIIAGLLLLLNRGRRPAAWVLAGLNAIFLLTLGGAEPHDLALNLVLGSLNLMFARIDPNRVSYRSSRGVEAAFRAGRRGNRQGS